MDVWYLIVLWFVASLDMAIAIEYAKIIVYKKAGPEYNQMAWFLMLACALISVFAVVAFVKGLGVL
jgi:hypothetical protein